ncbi:MAG: sulfatase, partial [Planctomycetaceae bacterium]
MSNPFLDNIAHVTRRAVLGSAAGGVGRAALASLLLRDATAAAGPAAAVAAADRGLPGFPPFIPKARRVVMLWQGGG